MRSPVLNRLVTLFMIGLLLTMFGCSDANESNPAGVSGYNYTDFYIDQFRVSNEGQNLSAFGSNIMPKEQGDVRSGGGEMCCIGIPSHWHSGMELVIKWKVNKTLDGKTPSKWYTAITKVPPYDLGTYGFVVHFLPRDRIRVEVRNKGKFLEKIDDHDPYIAQGVLDTELNESKENAQ